MPASCPLLKVLDGIGGRRLMRCFPHSTLNVSAHENEYPRARSTHVTSWGPKSLSSGNVSVEWLDKSPTISRYQVRIAVHKSGTLRKDVLSHQLSAQQCQCAAKSGCVGTGESLLAMRSIAPPDNNDCQAF